MHDNFEEVRTHASSPLPGHAPSDTLSSPYVHSQPKYPVPNLSGSDVLTSPSTPAPFTPPSNEPSQVREASSPLPLPERIADGVFLSDTNSADPLRITHNQAGPKSTKVEGARRDVDARLPLSGADLNQKPADTESVKHPVGTKEKKKKSKKTRYKESNQKSASPCPPPPPARNPALDTQPGLKTRKVFILATDDIRF